MLKSAKSGSMDRHSCSAPNMMKKGQLGMTRLGLMCSTKAVFLCVRGESVSERASERENERRREAAAAAGGDKTQTQTSSARNSSPSKPPLPTHRAGPGRRRRCRGSRCRRTSRAGTARGTTVFVWARERGRASDGGSSRTERETGRKQTRLRGVLRAMAERAATDAAAASSARTLPRTGPSR